jgi:hypothetical protein
MSLLTKLRFFKFCKIFVTDSHRGLDRSCQVHCLQGNPSSQQRHRDPQSRLHRLPRDPEGSTDGDA